MARRRRQPRSLSELRLVAGDLLREFTDPARMYAFAAYDNTPVHDGPLTPGDIFMANLLSLRLGWQEVIPLFAHGGSGGTVWTKLRLDLDSALDEARKLRSEHDRFIEAHVAMPKLDELNDHISSRAFPRPTGRRQRTWTEVTVSKVLHRLSPNVPLIDSTVRRFYWARAPRAIRQHLRQDIIENKIWLEPLSGEFPVRREPMPLLRVADILIWMDARRRR